MSSENTPAPVDHDRNQAAPPRVLNRAWVADLARWIKRRPNSQKAIRRHLEHELTLPDPWRLQTQSFERARHETILSFVGSDRSYARGLEFGCAAGALTERLAPRCRELLVVDVVPAAIERGSSRLKEHTNIAWRVADIATFTSSTSFDLIVVTEVLYYLGGGRTLRRTIRNLTRLLAPGGVLVFGSARDALCAGWGLRGGAETCMKEFSRSLRETARVDHRGAWQGQDCLIVRYAR